MPALLKCLLLAWWLLHTVHGRTSSEQRPVSRLSPLGGEAQASVPPSEGQWEWQRACQHTFVSTFAVNYLGKLRNKPACMSQAKSSSGGKRSTLKLHSVMYGVEPTSCWKVLRLELKFRPQACKYRPKVILVYTHATNISCQVAADLGTE